MRASCLLGWLVLAMPVDAAVDHYGVEHGLSQNSLLAIADDPRGFLWLGTEDGLNRFDGHRFKVFRSEPLQPGLSDSFIQRLAQADEVLWIGTIGGGLSRMDLRTERIVGLRDLLPEATIAKHTIFAVHALDAEHALVGTARALWWLHWGAQGMPSLREIALPGGGALVRAIAPLGDGRFVIGGEHVLCVLDHDLRDCAPLALHALGGQSPNVLALTTSASGYIWAGIEDEGLVRVSWQGGGERWWRFREELPVGMARVLNLAALPQGDVWIGSDLGVWRYRQECDCVRERVDLRTETPSGRKAVQTLHPAVGEALWMGFWNYGLERYDPRRGGIEGFRPSLPELAGAPFGNVRAFVFDGDGGWLGSYGRGVIEMRLGSDGDYLYRQPEALKPARISEGLVWALTRDRHGRLWIGSDGGLHQVDPIKGTRIAVLDAQGRALRAVRALLIDRNGLLWVGGELGLYCFDPARPERAGVKVHAAGREPLPDRRIFALHQDQSGRLWVGTWFGVYALDAERMQLAEALAPDAGLRVVWDIADADDGGLWVGSSDGLVHVAADGRWQRFHEAHGLANRVIYGVQRDDAGLLWLSSNRGLMRFNPDDQTVINFGLRDGLVQNEFLFGGHARDDAGRIWFGGTHGFQRIQPDLVARNDDEPRPVLTEVRVDGVALTSDDPHIDAAAPALERLRLDPGDRVLEIHYGAIAFDHPTDVRFQYRLEGYDANWQQAGDRRFALYTGVPPGRYRFEVRATSRSGRKSSDPRSLVIDIRPHWWQRRAVQGGMLIAVLLSVFALVRWRIGDLRAQRAALEQTVTLRTSELAAQRDELHRLNAELASLSTHDPLTGLANRRALLARLASDLSEAANVQRPYSLVLCDLDHFKRINDSHGHATGDHVLIEIGQLWSRVLPTGALLGRYGGEEFMLLLPGHDAAEAADLMKELLVLLRGTRLDPNQPELQVTSSAGVAQWLGPIESLERLIHRADEALYRAKRDGRDRVVLASRDNVLA